MAFLNPDRTQVQIENNFPSSDLVFVYNQLVLDLYGLESADLPRAALAQFLTYFSRTWMTNQIRWNVFHLDDHRTNNDLEGKT